MTSERDTRWNQLAFDPDETIGALMPWVEELKEQVTQHGLRGLPDSGAEMRAALNAALDALEMACVGSPTRFSELLLRLGVEDLLIGIDLIYFENRSREHQ